MKAVRFAEVVRQSGRPRVHALWVAPADDPEFARARRTDRVMTITHPAGGKADVGYVGFEPARRPRTEYLVFPKSLRAFDGQRVIGVKFDLVEQPPMVSPAPQERWAVSRARRHHAAATGGPAALARSPTPTTPGSPRERDGGGAAGSAPPAAPMPPAKRKRWQPESRRLTHAIARPPAAETPKTRRVPKSADRRRTRTAATRRPAETTGSPEESLRDAAKAALAEMRAGDNEAAFRRLEKAVAL